MSDEQGLPQGAIPVDEDEQGLPQGAIPVDQPETQQPQAEPLSDTQRYIGMAEAAGRGASFGLTTPIETALGVPKQDIEARERGLDPMTLIGAESAGAIGSMLIPGVGEGWLIAKGAKLLLPIAKEANAITKVGRLALRGAIEMGAFAGGDELSDAFLDKGHDATAVASHIASAGALGLLTGGVFGAGEQALAKIQNLKFGEYLDNVAMGLGAASQGPERMEALRAMHAEFGEKVPKGIEHGAKIFDAIKNKTAGAAVDAGAGLASHVLGGGFVGDTAAMLAANQFLAPYADTLASKYTPVFAKKVAVPIMLTAIKAGEYSDIGSVLDYANKAAKGNKIISNAVNDALNAGGKEAEPATEEQNDKLHKYMENGGINQQIQEMKDEQAQAPQGFAEGGVVHPKPMTKKGGLGALYPAQNQMISGTKGRVSQYLNQLRPQEPNKLMFDKAFEDKAKERSYRSALSVANAPVSVMSHVKNGTLLPEHMQHLKSMYPELHEHLSSKITKVLTQNQYDEAKKPSYKVQQALSLFLGSSLTNSLTPQSIMAAQATFQPQQPQQPQAPTKNKKGTSSLSKFSKDYQTSSQSREQRESKD